MAQPQHASKLSPDQGSRHSRARFCLLKGCERKFTPSRWSTRYCSAACVEAARRWSMRCANRRYRSTAQGKACRREQARQYRERRRSKAQETPQAPGDCRREGYHPPESDESFSARVRAVTKHSRCRCVLPCNVSVACLAVRRYAVSWCVRRGGGAGLRAVSGSGARVISSGGVVRSWVPHL